MKNTITLIALLMTSFLLSQNGINYKAVIKDDNGNVVANQAISILVSLEIIAGAIIYREEHTINTDDNGIAILVIGTGIVQTGDFNDINWKVETPDLNIQVDIGNGYVDMGSTSFQSVPYAMYTLNPDGLEAIDEGNGIGWRLAGQDPIYYGDIGENAIDLSYSDTGLFINGALGLNSFATGFYTRASGDFSTVMGHNSEASGDFSLAIGANTEATANYAISLGRFSIASGEGSTATGYSTLASGEFSTSMGNLSEAIGDVSTAMGNNTEASGNYSTAMGFDTVALGEYSTAMGTSTDATGYASTSLGGETAASASYATAMGFSTIAAGDFSTAMGQNTEASVSSATAMGRETVASGFSSTAMGLRSEASGIYSTAMGRDTDASGWVSTAMGSDTVASEQYSTAMGFRSTATGEYSTAMGDNTSASGIRSTAMGRLSVASGEYSTAMGYRTRATSLNSTAIGTYNIGGGSPNTWVETDRLFEIGNGVFGDNRNALTVLKNGNVGIGTPSPQELLHIDGGRLRIGTETIEDTGSNRLSFNADLLPDNDNSFRLGNSTTRWTSVWAADGSINTSDRRDKENITELNYGLQEIQKLKPVSFNWKKRPEAGVKLGLIAQDLQEVIPEVVMSEEVVYSEDDPSSFEKKSLDRLGVYYSDLIPVLIKAIQEQQIIINAEKLKVSNLEAQVEEFATIEARLERLEKVLGSQEGLKHTKAQNPFH